MNSETVSVRLRENRTALEALGVKSLALFGSAARYPHIPWTAMRGMRNGNLYQVRAGRRHHGTD